MRLFTTYDFKQVIQPIYASVSSCDNGLDNSMYPILGEEYTSVCKALRRVSITYRLCVSC